MISIIKSDNWDRFYCKDRHILSIGLEVRAQAPKEAALDSSAWFYINYRVGLAIL